MNSLDKVNENSKIVLNFDGELVNSVAKETEDEGSPERENNNGILQINSVNPEILLKRPTPPKKTLKELSPYQKLFRHILNESKSYNDSLLL